MIKVEIHDDILSQNGYIKVDKFQDIYISIHRAADYIGISPTTMKEYVKCGLVPSLEDKVPLDFVLVTTGQTLKKKYIESKRDKVFIK